MCISSGLCSCDSLSRSIVLFLKYNNIPFELTPVEKMNRNELLEFLPDYSEDLGFPILKDTESYIYECHAILKYLFAKNEHVDPQFYPSDIDQRTKIDIYLDWHQRHLRKNGQKALNLLNVSPRTSSDSRPKSVNMERVGKVIHDYLKSLQVLEKRFLSNDGDFLCGFSEPTLADLVAITELTFFKVINIDLSSYQQILNWYERVIAFYGPLWTEVHESFEEYVDNSVKVQQKQQAREQKIKKYGKDATGGNRAPDVCHTVLFQVPPIELFAMLTDKDTLSELLGSECTFSSKPGGLFSLLNGQVTGTNLYLDKGKRLLQSWRCDDWPKDHYSNLKILFQPIESGTELTLNQSDVPQNYVKKTDMIWDSQFWNKLDGVLIRNILQQEIFENLSPHSVYKVFTDSHFCSKLTNKTCDVSRGVGGDISYLDGTVTGKNIELVTDCKIVQQWRMEDWPSNHYSIVKIEIKRVAGGTTIVHTQENVPVAFYRQVLELWDRHFWKKMQQTKSM
eukprot:TRINITY_DN5629_c0_g1_i2.p1 TRINITY_DN5629_c0_g1~~TRINITY_DN5629_c0_g1_i2.p1  ORF type:complete len:508 (+),score=145.47 TRINITY_DN5629_c0_g1_i2:58-1581(+)